MTSHAARSKELKLAAKAEAEQAIATAEQPSAAAVTTATTSRPLRGFGAPAVSAVRSPASRAHAKKVAALVAADEASQHAEGAPPPIDENSPGGAEYRLLLVALGADLDTLRNIQSVERKIDAKRDMIEKYRDWVAGARNRGDALQDEIVATVMVWAIDIQDWQFALDTASYVLANGLSLPERYSRTPATLVAEEIADAALSGPEKVPFRVLLAAEDLTHRFDMHDQVRAKLGKAIGRDLARQADQFDAEAESAPAGGKAALLAGALTALRRALELNAKVGVKRDIEDLERALGKIAPPPETVAPETIPPEQGD